VLIRTIFSWALGGAWNYVRVVVSYVPDKYQDLTVSI
jgi:hypothetical protein